MERRISTTTKPPANGVITTIASGISTVVGYPFLLLVPVMLDLYFLYGWRVEPPGLASSLTDRVQRIESSATDDVVSGLKTFATLDLAAGLSALVPSFMGGVDRSKLVGIGARPEWLLQSTPLGILAIVAMVVGALALFMLFAVPLCDAALGRRRTPGETVRAIGIGWGRLAAMLLVVLGAIIAVVGPIALIAVGLQGTGVNLLPLFGSILLLVGVVAALFLYFSIDAILVAEVGPVRALLLSINVVRRNTGQTMVFVAASLLIVNALPSMGERIANSLVSVLILIVLNAFLATGLAAASMIFFNDRLRAWRPDLAFTPTPLA